jgi:ribosomal-protein-alanine N-acetyltransferase
MNIPEQLDTARLRLRRSKPEDVQAVFEYGSDPEVARYADWPRLTRLEDASRVVASASSRWESAEEYTWRLTVKPDDVPMGGVGCSIDGHRAELGYLVHRELWGRGYATEAAGAVFEWLRSVATVLRIQATCDIDNVGSVRVLEKLGMTRECTLRRWAVRPNLPGEPVRDAFLYAWVREA